MGRTVYLDEECCVVCGSCAELCPEVLEMDEEREVARVILPKGEDVDCVEDAIAACPEECISWEE